jgi:O-antigen ligase
MFPALAKGENAHNNFLQILAEQGWVGAASFIWLLLASAGSSARAIRSGQATPQLTGLLGGLVAFLVTCLAGHPLMMPQVVYFFLLVLGLVCGIAPPPAASSARWQRNIAIAFIIVIATSVPIRLANLSRFTNLDGVVLGASAPAGEIDDVEYRMAEAHSIWLVPASTSILQMPLRLAAGSKGPCRVTISLDGGDGDIVEPETGAWLNVRYTLPAGSKRASRRFDVRTTSDCQLMVGRLVSH